MPESPISYEILGPLTVRAGGERRTPTAKKHRLLLARLLISHGETVSVDRLAEALWGERVPPSARKLIQLYVNKLRERLGRDAIETAVDGYRLNVDPETIDGVRFERLAAEGRALVAAGSVVEGADILRHALELWRGSAYSELRHEDFVRIESERLDELRLDCLERSLEAEAALGDASAAIAELQALVAERPDREGPRAALMRAHYRAGRQADALAAYEEGRAYLDDALGLEPSPQLRELQRRILNHDPSLADGAGRSTPALPAAPTPLVGRERDVESLLELVSRDDVRLLTVAGAGGIGKSRLALELARRSSERFTDGVVLVELTQIRDERHVASLLGEAVGAPEASEAPSWEALGRFLAGRELLLVLDNVEHLAAVGPQLSALCRAAPKLTAVATSRKVLHVTGEQVYVVSPLEPADALALFRARAEAVAPGYGAGEEETMAQICARLDNLPLAIELAAARAIALTPSALLDRLGDRLGLLVDGPRDLPDRQRTLHETLRWSADLLSSGERDGLARLAPFTGGFGLSAAETAAGLSLTELQALVSSSLVNRVAVADDPRFSMLETVREYALELLGDGRAAAEKAHATFYADLAAAYREYLESDDNDGSRQSAWLARLDTDIANLRAALDWSIAAEEHTLALRLVGGLWRYWHVRGQLADGLDQIERVLAGAPAGEPRLTAAALVGAAGLAWGAGKRKLATTYARRAITETDDPLYTLSAETVLGLVASHDGDYAAAQSHHERSRAIAVERGWERHEMVSTINLGEVAYAQGDYRTATEHWLRYLAFWRDRESDEGIGLGTLNLGLAALRTGDLDQADRYFADALTRFQAIDFRAHVGHAMLGQAAVAAHRGDHDEATALLAAARTTLDEVGAVPETFDASLAAELDAILRTTAETA